MKKINPKLFRKSVSKFATGISIVTINNSDNYIGKTVNSFSSLSLDPPLILFSLDKNSSSINEYKKSLYFGINILSKKQKIISNYFSSHHPKWKNYGYFLTKNNVPILKDCIGNISCEKVKLIKQGDHIIFICKVIEITFDETKKPLIYFNSKYF